MNDSKNSVEPSESRLPPKNSSTDSKVEPSESRLPPKLLMATYASVTGASIAIIIAVIRYLLCGC